MTQKSAHLDEEMILQPFCKLDISPKLKQGIKDLGYMIPTDFQMQVFENCKSGKNIAGLGNSNYGKSLAFSLPILTKVSTQENTIQALVVCESALQSELCVKEYRFLGQHMGIRVGLSSIDDNEDQLPHILVVAVKDLKNLTPKDGLGDVGIIFLDSLSFKGAQSCQQFLSELMNENTQVLTYGEETINYFKEHLPQLFKDAIFIQNNDQPKMAAPAKHIFHQPKEDEPKPRALLAALEVHQPKSAIITCNDFQEGELLSRYLSRYGYKPLAIREDRARRAIEEALKELVAGSLELVICPNFLLSDQSLESIPFMINYDMFDRAQVYESITQFTKQAAGLNRVIVNLVTSRELGFLGPIKAQCQIDFTEMPLPESDNLMSICAKRISAQLNKEALDFELGQYEELAQKIFDDPSSRPGLALLLRNYFQKAQRSEKKVAISNEDQKERRSGRSSSERKPREKKERERTRSNSESGDAQSVPQDNGSQSASNNDGVSKLYVTLGKRDGFLDLAALAQYLSEKSGVDLGHFSGMGMVRDSSAHIEVDSNVAETLINAIHQSERPHQDNSEEIPDEETKLVVCERARSTSSQRRRRTPPRGRTGYHNRR